MENIHILPLLLFTFSFIYLKPTSGAEDDCLPASCGPDKPEIRFPFRLIGRQPSRCGFPGFDLSCDKNNLTTIRLPSSSRSFIVTRIFYDAQAIYIDPEFCRANRIADVNLTDTPFEFSNGGNYTFYNCSVQSFGFKYPVVPFPCLSSANYSVIAVRTTGVVSMPTSCVQVNEIMVPEGWTEDFRKELELRWFKPDCFICELIETACGLNSDDGKVTCFDLPRGIPRGDEKKFRLSIGIGVSALVCILGLACCMTTIKIEDYNETHHQSIDRFSVAIIRQPTTIRGLDEATIESYPKTLLGESCRLPNDDSTCAICLSDYKPKESLRTILECNHYFHVECIDKWIKLKATCPVCRNSLKSSSLVTSCSSTLSSS